MEAAGLSAGGDRAGRLRGVSLIPIVDQFEPFFGAAEVVPPVTKPFLPVPHLIPPRISGLIHSRPQAIVKHGESHDLARACLKLMDPTAVVRCLSMTGRSVASSRPFPLAGRERISSRKFCRKPSDPAVQRFWKRCARSAPRPGSEGRFARLDENALGPRAFAALVLAALAAVVMARRWRCGLF